MAAQDDARERRLIDLFNLERPANRVRHGVDAILTIDDAEIEFELKSITISRGGLTTVRDFGRDHIEKWQRKHWIVGVYNGDDMVLCRYGSPDDMAPWIKEKWEYIRPDLEMAAIAPSRLDIDDMFAVIGEKEAYSLADAQRLHKKQFSVSQYRAMMDVPNGYTPSAMLAIFRDRLRYVIERGSTLNNPKVSPDYLANWTSIRTNHAETLRTLVRAWQARQL